jgi:hypothetical protein
MNAADVLTFTALEVAVIVAIATTIAFVLGMMFGGRARDDIDAAQAGRDIAGEARAGRIERRRAQRPIVPMPKPGRADGYTPPVQPVDFERPRT